MGLFKFMQPSAPQKAVEFDVSFDLTTTYTPRKSQSSRTPRVPESNIPIEVVLHILEAAYYDDDHKPNTVLLGECSRVCKGWSTHAQKLLFRQICLSSQSAYSAFLSAVDRTTERGRILGDSVLRMRAVLDHNKPNGLSQLSFAYAVTLCPNLYEMDLSLYGCAAPGNDVVGSPALERMRRPAPSFDDACLQLLRVGPSISALQFSNWSENEESVIQLLEIWPSITSLAITGTSPVLSPAATYPPFPCALKELRINCQREPSPDFLEWLLHASAEMGSLRVLDFEREPSPETLDFLVEKHSETLHSLALPSCSSHEHAAAVTRCRELRELRTESAWSSPIVYRRIPDTIQHLSFGLDLDTPLQSLLDVVKDRDDLEALTVHLWGNGARHPHLPALQMACAYRGVDLRMTTDIRVLRTMVRGDPILPTSFPRTKTLENLQLMRS
ncbi:hypothetical protein BJ138DRAFT_1176360 [Hygrophoropsis aurantiaca]|uniref:Uncharacterized protein n=1 Tax=Hygrophoropsis aurantiaca TaxID=72124 RepID=A0ACB8ARZ8_9AGAM|nr:hypothetical protein BJ138DRAFT_1176360 [Hygrophoropsis aurantiaca]